MNLNHVYPIVLEDPSESDASGEPVTVDEAKAWIKVDVADDDDIIEQLITTARQQCEQYLKISLIERTIQATLLNQIGGIEIPFGPVNSIESFTDLDDNDIDSSSYKIRGEEGNFQWLQTAFCEAVVITYNAGYATLKKVFKTAIQQQTAWLYENRGDANMADQLSQMVITTLKPYRRVV